MEPAAHPLASLWSCPGLGPAARGRGSLVSHGAVAVRRGSGWRSPQGSAEGIRWQLPALDPLPRRKPSLLVNAVV